MLPSVLDSLRANLLLEVQLTDENATLVLPRPVAYHTPSIGYPAANLNLQQFLEILAPNCPPTSYDAPISVLDWQHRRNKRPAKRSKRGQEVEIRSSRRASTGVWRCQRPREFNGVVSMNNDSVCSSPFNSLTFCLMVDLRQCAQLVTWRRLLAFSSDEEVLLQSTFSN